MGKADIVYAMQQRPVSFTFARNVPAPPKKLRHKVPSAKPFEQVSKRRAKSCETKGHLKGMQNRNVGPAPWSPTALHQAVARGSDMQVRLLAERSPAQRAVRDADGRTPLH